MSKFLQFTHNFFGLLTLVGIVAMSGLLTISMSPIAVSNGAADVAGIQDSDEQVKVVSNLLPLQIVDLNTAKNDYLTQLVSSSSAEYSYNVRLKIDEQGLRQHKLLQVTNPNTIPASLTIKPFVSRDVAAVAHIAIRNGHDVFRIYNAESSSVREYKLDVAPSETVSLEIEYLVRSIPSFPYEMSLQISGN